MCEPNTLVQSLSVTFKCINNTVALTMVTGLYLTSPELRLITGRLGPLTTVTPPPFSPPPATSNLLRVSELVRLDSTRE